MYFKVKKLGRTLCEIQIGEWEKYEFLVRFVVSSGLLNKTDWRGRPAGFENPHPSGCCRFMLPQRVATSSSQVRKFFGSSSPFSYHPFTSCWVRWRAKLGNWREKFSVLSNSINMGSSETETECKGVDDIGLVQRSYTKKCFQHVGLSTWQIANKSQTCRLGNSGNTKLLFL